MLEQPVRLNNGIEEKLLSAMPLEVQRALLKFLLDKRSGVFRINVREGEIRSYHSEEIVRVM